MPWLFWPLKVSNGGWKYYTKHSPDFLKVGGRVSLWQDLSDDSNDPSEPAKISSGYSGSSPTASSNSCSGPNTPGGISTTTSKGGRTPPPRSVADGAGEPDDGTPMTGAIDSEAYFFPPTQAALARSNADNAHQLFCKADIDRQYWESMVARAASRSRSGEQLDAAAAAALPRSAML